MGISNEVFPTEREEKLECQFHTIPNNTSHPEKLFESDPQKRLDALSDVEKFAAFMRFLAPPEPSTTEPGGAKSIAAGFDIFEKIGMCWLSFPRTAHLYNQHSSRAAK